MGWDICSIGNHTLDTSSIDVLAKQLSEIFKINISCKAFNQYTDEKIDLGEVVYYENAEWFTLWDEFYFAKSLCDKTSVELENIKIHEWDLEDIESVKRGLVHYELNSNRDVGKKGLYELCYAEIMKDFINFSIMEPFRWFRFLDNLREKPNDYFHKYRQRNTEYYKKVGAKEIVYFPDQGTAQLILDKFTNSLWEEIKEYALEKKYYADHLSSCINSKNWEIAKTEYEEKDKCLVVNLSETLRNRQFFSSENYIEILYDDLRD